ncbi:Pyrroline-5-carboxylate reductase 2 [Bienertia sinuspersici]
MPQDKRRSISYRSFVTCDDPKGVECGAIRKTKMNSQKKEPDNNISNIEADRKQRDQSKSVEVAVIKEEREKKEMGIRGITRERLETPVSFQLLEVSKDANNLNHVINSWSSDKTLKSNQDYVAKDLLRGALDLQESLVMLGKLQEASSYMMGLARKQKQKLEEGTFDGMVSGVRGVERNGVRLVDECPRKSFDEMRNAVRDSLLRQNVITNPIFEENCDRRKMASPDMLPSTSSSQSSMVHSSNFVPSDSSVSSPASRKKGKSSNVIVKLMGLESFPSSPRKCMEREKILNMEKPVYEIDSPRARRPHLSDQEGGMKQRSVDEILENFKFKGLLRNTYMDDLTIDSSEAEGLSSEDSWVDEKPPIVVMKPLHYPCIDLDKPFLRRSQGERGMRPRYSRESDQEFVRNGVKFSEKYEREGNRVDCDQKAKSMKKVASPKPQKKQAEVKKASEIEKVTAIRRKGEEKKDAKTSDQSSSRDQEKLTTAKIRRNKDGKTMSKNPTSSRQKTASTPALNHRRQGTPERRKNRQPTVTLEEKRICKDEIHENMESKAVCREEIEPKDANNSVSTTVRSRIADSNDIERCQIHIQDYDNDSQNKLLASSDEIPDDEKNSHYDDNQSSHSEITSVSTGECCIVDQLDETKSPVHEVTLITTHENGVAVHHDTNQEEIKTPNNSIASSEKPDNETLIQCLTPRIKLKAFLLSNSSFVNHLDELFNIQVNPGLVPFVVYDNDHDYESAQVLIDCANEVLEIKSLQFSKPCLPLPRMYTTKSQSFCSLDWLLEEVCNEIEELRCYWRLAGDDNFPSDNLYILIDQDLRRKGEAWGVGWRHMFTQDEVEEVIGEIDKFVLGKLIEEVLSDFMP